MKPPSELPKRLPVGIWIRVSTDEQAQGDSPEHHEIRARTYAEAKDWEMREIYNLAGVSGKSVKEHPEAKRMLQDVKRGHIKGLIFSKLARFVRNTKELLEFADFFQEQNAALISLQEAIDTTTPVGRLFYTFVGAMAQWEREEIGDRIRVSVGIRAKLGKPLGGQAPYGYHWVAKKIVQHPDEAPIRKRAYELFAQYRRKGYVARLLNEAGYRTREGKEWYDMGVGRILADPSAKGVHIQNRSKKTGNWTSELKPESEWGYVEVEPIVSEELWTQVNQLMEEQRKASVRPGKRPKQLFAGIVSCKCGTRMYVPSTTPKYVCEKCRNRIPAVDLEAIFLDELKTFFTDPIRLAGHIQTAHKAAAEKEGLLETTRQQIQRVKDEMNRTHRLYLEGAVSVEGFKEFYGPAEERLKQLQAEQVRVQADVDIGRVNSFSVEAVLQEASDLQNRWPALSADEKRQIVESIVQSIIVDKDKQEIAITLSCLPTSVKTPNSQQHL
jgi:site-specific DNA recombinase